MCRYAMVAYKPHYICFECRKTFKRRLFIDIRKGNETPHAKCPQCGELMAEVGKDFKAPAKNAIKEWQHVKQLYMVGIRFFSCGCSGPGYIPADKEALIQYFQNIIEQYNKELDFWRNRIEPITQAQKSRERSLYGKYINKVPTEGGKKQVVANLQAIDYWLKKIREVEKQIRMIK